MVLLHISFIACKSVAIRCNVFGWLTGISFIKQYSPKTFHNRYRSAWITGKVDDKMIVRVEDIELNEHRARGGRGRRP